MESIVIEARKRTELGKNACRRLRQEGLIPAVIYGEQRDVRPISIDPRLVLKILKSESGENTLFHVEVEGEKTRSAVMIKEYQLDPVKDTLLHVDLIRISMTDLIKVKVPIQLQGDCKGVKTDGGILEFMTREVEIECLPANIPEHIDVDITELRTDDLLRLKDLQVDETIKILDDLESPIVHVMPPREIIEEEPEEEAEAAEGEEAPAEPEVIGKGKEEEPEKPEEPKKGKD
jgi:large subunit ribosomal protein L25